jgi:hypothetical protein
MLHASRIRPAAFHGILKRRSIPNPAGAECTLGNATSAPRWRRSISSAWDYRRNRAIPPGTCAFNDPPVADFLIPLGSSPVSLDALCCRQQQVNDGCFPMLGDRFQCTPSRLTIHLVLTLAAIVGCSRATKSRGGVTIR